MASNGPPVERWLELKTHIYHCYITENKTLMETMATLRDVRGFYARLAKFKSTARALAKIPQQNPIYNEAQGVGLWKEQFQYSLSLHGG